MSENLLQLLVTKVNSFEPLLRDTNVGWIAEQLGPVVTAVLAILLAFWSYKNTLKTQARDYQHQFQVRTYEKMLQEIQNAVVHVSTYSTLLSIFSSKISLDYNDLQHGRERMDWKRRPQEYMDAHYSCRDALVKLAIEIENILIIDPRFKVFIEALSSVIYDITETYNNELSTEFLRYLHRETMGVGDVTITVDPDVIDKSTLDRLTVHLDRIIRLVLIDAISYIHDLKLELQDVLLGDIYGKSRLPYRKPLDPKRIVIRLDRHKELDRFIRENTTYGASMK